MKALNKIDLLIYDELTEEISKGKIKNIDDCFNYFFSNFDVLTETQYNIIKILCDSLKG